MIIVRLMGGLGNQMFQYAAGLRLAKKHGVELKLDLAFLQDRRPKGFTLREFDLEIFQPPEASATAKDLQRYRYDSPGRIQRITNRLMGRRHFLEKAPFFDPQVLSLPDESYLEGYFQDERYSLEIASIIRERFELSPDESKLSAATREMADRIRSENSICLHVRRGDYLTNATASKLHGSCSLAYFQDALSVIRSQSTNIKVYIFSDDPVWCQENFNDTSVFTIVGDEHAGTKASGHLWLMSLCKHFVISNSSFSWWAAWLAAYPDKMVIRPARWFRLLEYQEVDPCPVSWIKVSNE